MYAHTHTQSRRFCLIPKKIYGNSARLAKYTFSNCSQPPLLPAPLTYIPPISTFLISTSLMSTLISMNSSLLRSNFSLHHKFFSDYKYE